MRIEESVEIAVGESFESAKLMKWKLACLTPSVDRLGRNREQFGQRPSRIVRFDHLFIQNESEYFVIGNIDNLSHLDCRHLAQSPLSFNDLAKMGGRYLEEPGEVCLVDPLRFHGFFKGLGLSAHYCHLANNINKKWHRVNRLFKKDGVTAIMAKSAVYLLTKSQC